MSLSCPLAATISLIAAPRPKRGHSGLGGPKLMAVPALTQYVAPMTDGASVIVEVVLLVVEARLILLLVVGVPPFLSPLAEALLLLLPLPLLFSPKVTELMPDTALREISKEGSTSAPDKDGDNTPFIGCDCCCCW